MTLTQKIALSLNRRYMESVVRDIDALRFFLNNSADAESNGESAIFEKVKPFLDGKIAKLVDRHAADEVRHAQLFTDALRKVGGQPFTPPESTRMVERVGERAGDVWNKPLESARDVARVYLLLYAIERRAVERFTLMEEVLRPIYPEIADVFARVKKDEKTHLHYCVAVSKDALKDDAEWTELRDEMVELEARSFTKQSSDYMHYLLDHVFTTMPWYEKAFWKTARAIRNATGRPDYVLDIGGAGALPGSRDLEAAPLAA